MLESIELIQNYLTSISEADFAVDIEKQDAVIRRLEIIGEACKQVLPDTKGKFPDHTLERDGRNEGCCNSSVLWCNCVTYLESSEQGSSKLEGQSIGV